MVEAGQAAWLRGIRKVGRTDDLRNIGSDDVAKTRRDIEKYDQQPLCTCTWAACTYSFAETCYAYLQEKDEGTLPLVNFAYSSL